MATNSAKRRLPTRPTPKPRAVRPKVGQPQATEAVVRLVRTKGSPGRGGGPEGEAWRIEAWEKRAGVIFTNMIETEPIGRHASIQIFLNTVSQGRHIGSIAYRMACELSRHDVIYAHMRKSNTPSIRAATNAGFEDATPKDAVQKTMVYRKRPHP